MKRLFICFICCLTLVSCKTAEEVAADHFEKAKILTSEGDRNGALLELRNALTRDESLNEARRLMADLLLQAGRTRDAHSQYAVLVERNPQDAAANLALAKIAFEVGAWEESLQFIRTTLNITPDSQKAQAVLDALNYRQAVLQNDVSSMIKIAGRLRKTLETDSSSSEARRVLISEARRKSDFEIMRDLATEGLKQYPKSKELMQQRLFALEQLKELGEVEKQLITLIETFQDDQNLTKALIVFYLREGRVADASEFLKQRIDPTSDTPAARLLHLRFISETGSDALVLEEINKTLALEPLPNDVASNLLTFQGLRGRLMFSLGEEQEALAYLQNLVVNGDPSAQLDRVKLQLARLEKTTGNQVGARTLVEQVLERDPGQTEGLKLRATWLIDENSTDAAIRNLRDALTNNPHDAEALTLLASAYQREGRTELMSDMLARAVEASRQGVNESIRFSTFLMSREEFVLAEGVLINAIRQTPNDLRLLTSLARLHIQMQDWSRAIQDIETIRRRAPSEQGLAAANELQARLLAAQGKAAELESFLEQLVKEEDGAVGARIAFLRNTIRNGNLEQAQAQLAGLMQDYPANNIVQLMNSQLLAMTGDTEGTHNALSALTKTAPDFELGWWAYHRLLLVTTPAKAPAVLEDGRSHLPDSHLLAVTAAETFIQSGEIDKATNIYENLYRKNTNDSLAANNFVSLRATTPMNDELLEEVWGIARRFRGINNPAFSDTYGWVAFLQGDYDEALVALEAAATNLPNDPSVQYHLGSLYLAIGRPEDARALLVKAKELLDDGVIAYPDLYNQISSALQQVGALPSE